MAHHWLRDWPPSCRASTFYHCLRCGACGGINVITNLNHHQCKHIYWPGVTFWAWFIIKITSYDRLISTMGFPKLVRHLILIQDPVPVLLEAYGALWSTKYVLFSATHTFSPVNGWPPHKCPHEISRVLTLSVIITVTVKDAIYVTFVNYTKSLTHILKIYILFRYADMNFLASRFKTRGHFCCCCFCCCCCCCWWWCCFCLNAI